MPASRRRATYQDVIDAPEHKVAEIIDGELFVSPRPASPHARATAALHGDLDVFDRDPESPGRPGGGWWILVEPELHFGEDVLVPDLAGWRRERMPRIPNTPAFTLAPDWVCEVISPSTARLDRTRKMGAYAREGVSHLWIVDPLQHTLEGYRLESGCWTVADVRGGWETVRVEPFAAVELDMTRWWLDPPPAG